MNVTVARTALLRSLAKTSRIVEKRNTIPVLGNVLLKASGDRLVLRATDLDVEVTETVEAQVGASGGVTVPAHTLQDIVRKLPDDAAVTMSSEDRGGGVTVRAGRSRFTLGGLPEADHPDLAAGEMTHTFEMDGDDLLRIIRRVEFAISKEETRYYLNGIYLHLDTAGDGKMMAVATDGHRLARSETAMPAGASGMPGVIVPRKTVAEVERLVDGLDGTVQVSLSKSKIMFRAGSTVLVSKLIDGTFPDYARVIPRNNDKEAILNTASFRKAVDRVATISSERALAIKVDVAPEGMVLTMRDPDSGDAVEELDASYDSSPISVGFNPRYVLDILARVDGTDTRMMMSDGSSPAIFLNGQDPRDLYVLMPMRV